MLLNNGLLCTSREGTTAISAEMTGHGNGLKLHRLLLFKVQISGVERPHGVGTLKIF